MTRVVAFGRVFNFRDLGGYLGAQGRPVRWRQLYRSDNVARFDDADWVEFAKLGVRTVIDLRHPLEVEANGRVRAADGLAWHNLSIEHRPYDQPTLAPDVDPERFLADRYLEVAEDGVVELRAALDLMVADGSTPLVFHCAAGKDRTGLLAAIVLTLLGVAEDDVVADFALTGLATDRLVARWRANHPGRDYLWPAYAQAPAGTMRLTLAALADRYGSVADYTRQRLGVDDDLIGALRSRYLE